MLSDREHNLLNKQPSKSTDASASCLAARYGIEDGHSVVLYAGSFESYQGLDLLVGASSTVVQKRNNVRFLCLGGNDVQIAKVKAWAQQHGVAGHFILPGTVPPEEVKSHFPLASVLVSPRILGTNTPLKIYSYLRSGVPIVATDILCHTQVLTAEVALLVKPQPESLAGGILTLLDHTQLSQHLVSNALRLAHEAYSPEAYHAKIAKVYSFLAGRSRREN